MHRREFLGALAASGVIAPFAGNGRAATPDSRLPTPVELGVDGYIHSTVM
jgi:hypothetical protein